MIRCIAIDDENLSLELIEDDIRKVPFLELVKACRSGFDAMEILKNEKIDLLFLDIQMPDMSGIQFLKSLTYRPLVIFTTAYEKYALEGFELDVIDYLLKPYSFERFLKSVNKAREYLSNTGKGLPPETADGPRSTGNFFFVKSDYKLVKIETEEILYIESLKDYIKIFTGVNPVLTLSSMKTIEDRLPSPDFIRVHRSFIVNLRKIQYIRRNFVVVENREIPIGENYREGFLKAINQNKMIE